MSVDLLYERLMAKLDAEAFPAGKPADAPLQGIEEAVKAMEVAAEELITCDQRSLAFPFFDKDAECLESPSASADLVLAPLRTSWWNNVRDWQQTSKKLYRDIEERFGDEAATTWANEEGDECYNNLRAAVHHAWESKHPRVEGGWDDDCVHYVIKV